MTPKTLIQQLALFVPGRVWTKYSYDYIFIISDILQKEKISHDIYRRAQLARFGVLLCMLFFTADGLVPYERDQATWALYYRSVQHERYARGPCNTSPTVRATQALRACNRPWWEGTNCGEFCPQYATRVSVVNTLCLERSARLPDCGRMAKVSAIGRAGANTVGPQI